MTEKQISQANRELVEKYGDDFKARHDSKEQKELNCRGMIDSLLCYHYYDVKDAKEIIERERKRYHDYLKQYIDALGEQRVIELINEQRASIYAVLFNVGEDNEGVSYNSTIYIDDTARINEHKVAKQLGYIKEHEYYEF